MKICPKCKLEKTATQYYKKGVGLSWYCKECTLEKQKEYDKNNPYANRSNKLNYYHKKRLARHKMSVEQFEQLKLRQLSCCAICGTKDPRWNIDHCHKTNKVRGLLCFSCNVGLGSFKDDKVILKRAIAYLNLVYETI